MVIDIDGVVEAELRRAHAQLAIEKHLLEMTASGRPLGDVLDAVCRFVEELSPECLCGVYPIDWSGLTKQKMRLTVKIRYAPADAGPPD